MIEDGKAQKSPCCDSSWPLSTVLSLLGLKPGPSGITAQGGREGAESPFQVSSLAFEEKTSSSYTRLGKEEPYFQGRSQ